MAYKYLIENKKILEVKVKGIEKLLYYSADDNDIMEMAISGDKYKIRIEFLAPLDNLMWDRAVISELFDFDYKWEVYTPKVDRKYGHYVLPVLFGEGFAGRIELIRNKKEKRFEEKIWMCDDSVISENDVKSRIPVFENVMY